MKELSVKEMFLVPKDVYFKSMSSLEDEQKRRVNDVNVEQLNVSCGPLFAGLRYGKNDKRQVGQKSQVEKKEENEKEKEKNGGDKKVIGYNQQQQFQNEIKSVQNPSSSTLEGMITSLMQKKFPQMQQFSSQNEVSQLDKRGQSVGKKANGVTSMQNFGEDKLPKKRKIRRRKMQNPLNESSSDKLENTNENESSVEKAGRSKRVVNDLSTSEDLSPPSKRLNSTANLGGKSFDPYTADNDDVFEQTTEQLKNTNAEQIINRKSLGAPIPEIMFSLSGRANRGKSAEESVLSSILNNIGGDNVQERLEVQKSVQKRGKPKSVQSHVGAFENSSSRPVSGSMNASKFYNKNKADSSAEASLLGVKTRQQKAHASYLERMKKRAKGANIPFERGPPSRVVYK